MLKLNNTKQRSLIVFGASQPDLETGRRFIVPVLKPEVDLTTIACRVWEIAHATGSSVQFLGLCADAVHELELRRNLATVSAMTNYGDVSAETAILVGRNWLENIRSYVQTGDAIIYWDEQFSKLLHIDLGVPIYFIPDSKPGKVSPSNWVTQAAAWIGSITIIVFFFFMQIQIEQHITKGWGTVMELLSIAGEFSLIWFWNNLL